MAAGMGCPPGTVCAAGAAVPCVGEAWPVAGPGVPGAGGASGAPAAPGVPGVPGAGVDGGAAMDGVGETPATDWVAAEVASAAASAVTAVGDAIVCAMGGAGGGL